MALDRVDDPNAPAIQPIADIADLVAQTQDARRRQTAQVKIVGKLVVHTSQCRTAQCKYPKCRKVKDLCIHGSQCEVLANGGCDLCKQLWRLLHFHAVACEKSVCPVPRCRDLKEHMRANPQQGDLPAGAVDMVIRELSD